MNTTTNRDDIEKNKGMARLSYAILACALAWASLGSLAGCSQVGRGMGGALGNKYAAPDAGITWNLPAPDLEPPSDSKKTVYLTIRNISDAEAFDIKGALQQGIQNQGYRIISDPEKANYRLKVSIRYFGENEAADGGRGQANLLGAVSGAAVGVGTGAAIHAATGSSLGAVAGGGIVGAGVGIAMANATKPREWDLIADVLLEERLAKAVNVETVSDQQAGSATGSVAVTGHDRTQGQVVSGGAASGTRSTMTVKRKTNYMPYGIRVTGWARQMAMTREEAIPLIQAKLASAPAGLLP
jgi:hypothetical protein